MPCYHPMQAWQGEGLTMNGKRQLVFDKRKTRWPDEPIEISCGQCIGCRLERSRQWATRCLHEASLHDENCFITLTFSDEGLLLREQEYIKKNLDRVKYNNAKFIRTFKRRPRCKYTHQMDPLIFQKPTRKLKKLRDVPVPQSIHVEDLQLFMKRLRKCYGKDIRFFACGEYGDENKRPHYHACLFNFNFPDRKQFKETSQGHKLFRSEALEKLWPYGLSTVGQVTFDSAAYVARYVMKKVNGAMQEKHYQLFDRDSWEVVNIKPEFVTMSRRQGIGFKWFEKYNEEIYNNDYCVVNGKKVPAPKYYDEQLKLMDEYHYDIIKDQRLNKRDANSIDNTPERLAIREKVKKLRTKQLTREV